MKLSGGSIGASFLTLLVVLSAVVVSITSLPSKSSRYLRRTQSRRDVMDDGGDEDYNNGKEVTENSDHLLGKHFEDLPDLADDLDSLMDDFSDDTDSETIDALDDYWTFYKNRFDKSYFDEPEEKKRRKLWERNVRSIIKHNVKAAKRITSSRVQINKFSDVTAEEMSQMMGYKKITKSSSGSSSSGGLYKQSSSGGTGEDDGPTTSGNLSPLEEIRKEFIDRHDFSSSTIDYRDTGCVTAIKNQGSCGSCWAFSSVSAIESFDCLYNLQLSDSNATSVSMSEQQLIDCSEYLGNLGCNGGEMQLGFVYVKDNSGLNTEECYSYTGVTGSSCNTDSSSSCNATTDIGFYETPELDEESLTYHTMLVGPMTVAVAASNVPLYFYESGVIDDADCSNSSSDLNHGVNVVGLGSDSSSGLDYYLMRNSWGTDWGDDGYFKIARNANNMCGIAWDVSFPAMSNLVDDAIKELGTLYVEDDSISA